MLEIIRKLTENKTENIMPDRIHLVILFVPMPEQQTHEQTVAAL